VNIPLEDIPESSRGAIWKQIRLYMSGFTGKIELDCNDGGVRSVAVTYRTQGDKLREETATTSLGEKPRMR